MSAHPERFCMGAAASGTGTWCGKVATVLVTEPKSDNAHPLQWFACDDPGHHRLEGLEGLGTTEPIAEWFAKIEVPAR